ncbi:MAG TPA: hypothetical protein DHN33_02655 [Eubacteriaceae bacterium]|nr:hypothetical protein [Eubacteriaceae bacterium]
MDSVFELFDILLPILIIGGSALFKRSSDQKKEEEKSTRKKQQTVSDFDDMPSFDAADESFDYEQESFDYEREEKVQPVPATTTESGGPSSIQSDRKDQMDQLKERLNLDSDQEKKKKQKKAEKMRVVKRTKKSHHRAPYGKTTAAYSMKLRSNLNKNGIRQGIVMAEILGPPRSKQPHAGLYKR